VTSATIKTHLRHGFQKTGFHWRAELSRLFAIFPPINAANG
jgi:DNA-binding CsgD family transcriptional regulator